MASVSRGLPALVLIALLAAGLSCGSESRTEGRQRRLDTFRSVLPDDVRTAFDGIGTEEDCDSVAMLLTEARQGDPQVDAALDSIMDAELIETFSDRDVVYFFWYYFAHAIETGTVPEP